MVIYGCTYGYILYIVYCIYIYYICIHGSIYGYIIELFIDYGHRVRPPGLRSEKQTMDHPEDVAGVIQSCPIMMLVAKEEQRESSLTHAMTAHDVQFLLASLTDVDCSHDSHSISPTRPQ